MMFDYQIFKAVNDLAGRWVPLDWFGIFCAKYLIFVIFLFVVLPIIFYKSKKEKMERFVFAIRVFLSGIFAYVLKLAMVLFYNRPRPFATHDVVQLVNRSADGSFPSSHAAVAFAVAFLVFLHNKKYGVAFIFLAFLVGLGRIYVGVHYPLDIMGGILVGGLSALVVEKISKSFRLKI
jgi:undecaprenyl-diphosphatase